MIMADKIIENRKKNGWSQEELADKLGVSRQSVSKWESAQSVPDMKRILQLSEVFGVTTDYLLKDDIEAASPMELAPVEGELEDAARSVSVEEANAFLSFNAKAARLISTGVMLCILSPVLMIGLEGLAETETIPIGQEVAGACGLAVLLIMIAIAVAMFLICGIRGKQYDYLEEVDIDTQYGVTGFVKELRADYAETHSRRLIVGIMLCIISAIPLAIMEILRYSNNSDAIVVFGVCGLLILCAIGVKLIVLTCILQGGYDKLLEEGDYTRINKRIGKYEGIYWAIVTAGYLAWSFITMRWDMTWIVWPVAGVLFAAYREIIKAVIRSRQ